MDLDIRYEALRNERMELVSKLEDVYFDHGSDCDEYREIEAMIAEKEDEMNAVIDEIYERNEKDDESIMAASFSW